ncbi:MAG: hypothetical protein EHM18_00280, partial [Acidobacteria bacterium]
MIGVLAHETDRAFVEELFELFKTPWEFADPASDYAVVISFGIPVSIPARLQIVFTDAQGNPDAKTWQYSRVDETREVFEHPQSRIPVYGGTWVFRTPSGARTLLSCDTGVVAFSVRSAEQEEVRVGFNLIREVRILLEEGQPPRFSTVPTLELHIAFLRWLILRGGIPILEILPVPAQTDFVCCLTHDIDFWQLSRHRLDRTFWGFLYRAVLGSPVDVFRGKRKARDLWRNWKAAASLPFVFLGLTRDPWRPFESYLGAERGRKSTFFLSPRKYFAGKSLHDNGSRHRAISYEAGELPAEIRQVVDSGSEVGLHGLDAWSDVDAARSEQEKI